MAHARVATIVPLVVVAACGGAQEPVAEVATAAASAPPVARSFDGVAWATFHSKRFELSLRFPDGPAWRIDDHRSPWLRAAHEGTRSRFALRSWREEENVTRAGCYERARGWDQGLPNLEGARLLEDGVRPVDGQNARVVVGLQGLVEGASIGGFVLAIVGEVHRCLLVAYQTEAVGAAAEGDVADRLAIVADRLLPTIKLDQSFAPSREPAIPSRGPGGTGGPR